MEIGKIIDLNFDRGNGYIAHLESPKAVLTEKGVDLVETKIFFSLLDYQSKYTPENLRLVVFEREKSSNGEKAISVCDFTPDIHLQFHEAVLGVSPTGANGISFTSNVHCFDFFLDKHSASNFSQLREIAVLLDNKDYFDIEFHLIKYSIEISEGHSWNPGKDDKAWINLVTRKGYPHYDSYLQKILPNYVEEIGCDWGFSYWGDMMESLRRQRNWTEGFVN